MRFHLWLMTALEQADSQSPLKMEISNSEFKLKLADYVIQVIGRPIPYFSDKNLSFETRWSLISYNRILLL